MGTTYCYDTEFLEDGHTIELISIGIVSDTGREYYAVNSDMRIKRIRRSDWLMANVVPGLPKPAGDWNLHMPRRWLFDYRNHAVKKRDQIATEVREFLHAEDTPELWANHGDYDHVVLCQLWGSMIDLPAGNPMFTHDIQQALETAPGFEAPEQTHGQHNALEDARHNLRILNELRTFTADRGAAR